MKTKCNLILALIFNALFTSLVLADGDITATVRGGNLRITGGRAAGQMVKIEATSTRFRYLITVNTGTTINGASSLFVDSVTGNIDIRLAATESIVIISDGPFSRIEINGNLNISTSSRDYSIIALDTVVCHENIFVSTGSGKDAILMGQTNSRGTTTVRTGSNDDVVFGYRCNPEVQLNVDLGSANDMLMFDQTFSSAFTFRGAGGNDTLAYENPFPVLRPTTLTYDGGAGVDQSFHNSTIAPTYRRMEESFGGDFDDLLDTAALTHDVFYAALLLWALLDLES